MASDYEKKLQALADAERERAKAAFKAELPELDPEMLLSSSAVREMRAASSTQFAGVFGKPKIPVVEAGAVTDESPAFEEISFEFETGEIEFTTTDMQVDFTPRDIEQVSRTLSQVVESSRDAEMAAMLNRADRLRQAGVTEQPQPPSDDHDWELGAGVDTGDTAGPDLSALFMNREAMQAQEALGPGSPLHMPVQMDEPESEFYAPRRYASFGGGTVVSQRGEDGRFHATGAVVAAVRPVEAPPRAVTASTRDVVPMRDHVAPARAPARSEAPAAPAPTAFARLGKDFDDF